MKKFFVQALRKQYTTSTMNDGTRFPISVYLRSQEMDDVEGTSW